MRSRRVPRTHSLATSRQSRQASCSVLPYADISVTVGCNSQPTYRPLEAVGCPPHPQPKISVKAVSSSACAPGPRSPSPCPAAPIFRNGSGVRGVAWLFPRTRKRSIPLRGMSARRLSGSPSACPRTGAGGANGRRSVLPSGERGDRSSLPYRWIGHRLSCYRRFLRFRQKARNHQAANLPRGALCTRSPGGRGTPAGGGADTASGRPPPTPWPTPTTSRGAGAVIPEHRREEGRVRVKARD